MSNLGMIRLARQIGIKARNSQLLHNRWLRLGLQTFIVVICMYFLTANLRSIREAQLELRLDLVFQAGALAVAAAFLGAVGWWLILYALGQPVRWGDAARVHLYANLAKYVPGYAWQLLGKAYLTRQLGVSVTVVALAMTLELLQLILAGLWIAALALPNQLIGDWLGTKFWAGWVWIIRLALSLVLIGLPFAATWLARQKRGWGADVLINPWFLLGSTFCMIIGWWLNGLSFWMLGAALQSLSFEYVGIFMFTLAVSFLVGLAVIIVPGSIGVRETIMVLILELVVDPSVAVIIAALSRLVLTLGELVSAFCIWVVQRIRH